MARPLFIKKDMLMIEHGKTCNLVKDSTKSVFLWKGFSLCRRGWGTLSRGRRRRGAETLERVLEEGGERGVDVRGRVLERSRTL